MSNLTTVSRIVVGEVDWMRNDYIHDITVGGIKYPSVEHAYQASKFRDPALKKQIADAMTVRAARQVGRGKTSTIREDWDDVKYQIMESLVRQKFTSDPILSDRLSKTGTATIVMEGYDEFWGTGKSGFGENSLGLILEAIRSEIQFLNGSDEQAEEEEEDEVPNLKDAIMQNPDETLADACQELYVGVMALMELVDPNDFDATFISKRTGVSKEKAEDAIQKLQSMQSALNSLKDLLSEEAEGEFPSVDDKDDDIEPEPSAADKDDWLKAFD